MITSLLHDTIRGGEEEEEVGVINYTYESY